MLAEVEVLHPGLFSSIQDKGRFGFMGYGVPVSGPMDSYAAKMANLLLKNPENSAVMEITQMGPKLRFSETAVIAITGANLSPTVNGEAVENNQLIVINAGDVLQFGKRIFGCRTYLAVKGGFQTEEVLKSRSWYQDITSFARLEKGMKLAYPVSAGEGIVEAHATIRSGSYISTSAIEAFSGPEFDRLSASEKERLENFRFSPGNDNDRMGIQLSELFPNKLKAILTAPVLPGTVQLTPSGRIIVLMRDGQTTGGYPRILQLSQKGINTLAQKVPGDSIYFAIKTK